MIWFIIGFIVFIVMTIKLFCDDWYSLGEKLLDSLFILLASFLTSLIVCIAASGITTACAEVDYKVISDTKIVALKDNQNVSGSFYIMGGYVDEDLYYYYAKETEFGYKTEKIKASDAYIKYTDDEAHIETHQGEFTSGVAYLFGFPMNESRYVIYCPEGTITNEFSVDLE